MKRFPGVVFSAVVLLLGSLFQLLMAALMAFAGAIGKTLVHSGTAATPPTPPWMPIFMWVVCGFFVALAVWGILTSVGLFRMRRWARYSVLVIGGCLAVFCSIQVLMSLVLIAVSFPVPTNVDPSQSATIHSMTKVIFGGMAVFYGIVAGVGIFWLVYFNLKKVREVFATGMGEFVPSPRPLLISVLAVFNLIGGLSCLLMALLPIPGFFLGLTLHGWGKQFSI